MKDDDTPQQKQQQQNAEQTLASIAMSDSTVKEDTIDGQSLLFWIDPNGNEKNASRCSHEKM